jgi:Cation transporter/ATPase, N-terminus
MLEEERTSWHTLDTAELLDRQASHPRSGLPAAEADARLALYGPNELIDRGGRTLWQILLGRACWSGSAWLSSCWPPWKRRRRCAGHTALGGPSRENRMPRRLRKAAHE